MLKLLYLPPEFSKFYELVDLDEKDKLRLKKFPHLQQKVEWRVARVGKFLVRTYFKTNNFCLTHKKNNVLFSFSDCITGIDLELIDRKRDISALSKEVFSPEELELMEKAQNPYEFFYQLWTIKESIIKAENLNFPSQLKEIGIFKNNELKLKNNKTENSCLIQGFLNDDYIFSALFLESKKENLELDFYSPQRVKLSFLGVEQLKVNFHLEDFAKFLQKNKSPL